MANTENIEAKLAAYVDDELDAAARAEIEEHLAANPQHRVLIEELRQQKDYLRAIPRVNAPPEIAEAVAAQLERAALLGDVQLGGEDAATNFSMWPQVRAIAAVIILTVGLAGILYKVLPSPKNNPPPVAMVIPEPGHDREPREDTAGERDRLTMERGAARSMSPALATPSAPEPRDTATAMRTAGATGDADRHELFLLIDTPDPTDANRQVVEYLDRVKCDYRQVPTSEVALADSKELKDLGVQPHVRLEATSSVTGDTPPPSTAPSTAPSGGNLGSISDSATATSATSNAPALPPGAQIAENRYGQPTTQQAEGQAAQIAPNAIVAKLTRDEAEQLSTALSQPQQRQQAQIVWPPEQMRKLKQQSQSPEQKVDSTPSLGRTFDKAATTEPTNEQQGAIVGGAGGGATTGPALLASGDVLRVPARELHLPGVEPVDETQTIDADGFINVSGVGQVSAAGLTTEQLSKQLDSQSVTRSNQLQAPATELTWSVERMPTKTATFAEKPAAPPGTQPANSVDAAAAASPTTTPADNTMRAGLDDGREEVVILLRSNRAAPATAPTTEPAPTPAPATSPATAPASQPTTAPMR